MTIDRLCLVSDYVTVGIGFMTELSRRKKVSGSAVMWYLQVLTNN